MADYEKPVILANDDVAEGVYAASGDNVAKCDSVYMLGVWQAQDTSPWGETTPGYKQVFGCLGCPAHTANGCGLQTHYIESGQASSYDVDDGNRMPSWERKGYGPDDPVTDFNM